MSRVPANISDNEDRLTLELVADLCKDHGAQWSDKKPIAKAVAEVSAQYSSPLGRGCG